MESPDAHRQGCPVRLNRTGGHAQVVGPQGVGDRIDGQPGPGQRSRIEGNLKLLIGATGDFDPADAVQAGEGRDVPGDRQFAQGGQIAALAGEGKLDHGKLVDIDPLHIRLTGGVG